MARTVVLFAALLIIVGVNVVECGWRKTVKAHFCYVTGKNSAAKKLADAVRMDGMTRRNWEDYVENTILHPLGGGVFPLSDGKRKEIVNLMRKEAQKAAYKRAKAAEGQAAGQPPVPVVPGPAGEIMDPNPVELRLCSFLEPIIAESTAPEASDKTQKVCYKEAGKKIAEFLPMDVKDNMGRVKWEAAVERIEKILKQQNDVLTKAGVRRILDYAHNYAADNAKKGKEAKGETLDMDCDATDMLDWLLMLEMFGDATTVFTPED